MFLTKNKWKSPLPYVRGALQSAFISTLLIGFRAAAAPSKAWDGWSFYLFRFIQVEVQVGACDYLIKRTALPARAAGTRTRPPCPC